MSICLNGIPFRLALWAKFLFGCFFLFKKSTPVACQPNRFRVKQGQTSILSITFPEFWQKLIFTKERCQNCQNSRLVQTKCSLVCQANSTSQGQTLSSQSFSGQTHYKKYFHKSWREGVRHRAKRLFLGLPRERHYNSFYTPKNVERIIARF